MWFSRWFRLTRKIDTCGQWQCVTQQSIGGLTEFGFSEDEQYFLVCSQAGRCLFEYSTGQRVARDLNPTYPERESNAGRYVEGIGPLSDLWVRVHSLSSGKLNEFSPTGWKVDLVHEGDMESVIAVDLHRHKKYVVAKPIADVHAFGFSYSGRYLALATSSDVVLYAHTG